MDFNNLSKEQLIKFKNMTEMVKDLILGDESIANRLDYDQFNFTELQEGLNLLLNSRISDQNKNIILRDSWKLIYREKPAYIEEFLSPKYLGGTYEALYPYASKILIQLEVVNH